MYHLGVLITISMMTVKGTFQVIGKNFTRNVCGFAGIGHTGMLAGLLLLFLLQRQAILTEPKNKVEILKMFGRVDLDFQ